MCLLFSGSQSASLKHNLIDSVRVQGLQPLLFETWQPLQQVHQRFIQILSSSVFSLAQSRIFKCISWFLRNNGTVWKQPCIHSASLTWTSLRLMWSIFRKHQAMFRVIFILVKQVHCFAMGLGKFLHTLAKLFGKVEQVCFCWALKSWRLWDKFLQSSYN